MMQEQGFRRGQGKGKWKDQQKGQSESN
jgi:hypothetical protein